MSTVRAVGSTKYRLDFTLFGIRFRKVFDSCSDALFFDEQLKKHSAINNVLIKDAAVKYLQTMSNRKKAKSQAVDKKALTDLLLIVGGEKYVYEIKPYHLEEYRTSELARGAKASSVNRKFNTIKHFFKCCENWELISNSPARNISKLGEVKVQKNLWTLEQIEIIKYHLTKRDRNIFTLTAITGCRLSSALSLRWGDINFAEKKVWLVTRKGPKSEERKYYFPLTNALICIFQQSYQQQNSNDYVFLSKNSKKVDANHYSVKISKLLKRLLPNYKLTLHGLRNSFATELHRKGVPLNDIKTLLGHSTTKVTEGYISVNEQDLIRHVS